MPKKILFLLQLFFTCSLYGQVDRIKIQGKILSDSTSVENVHIINKNSRKATISNQNGSFKIPVRVNDTLQFSAIQYQTKLFIIDKFLLENTQLITIYLSPKINRLKEVIVKRPNNMAIALGLPNADKKPLTKIESRLNYHTKASLPIAIIATILGQSGGLEDIFYIASGKRKKDRKLQNLIDKDKFSIQTEKDVQKIRIYFKDKFFIETLQIPTNEINFFIKHCLKNNIIYLFQKERHIEIIDIFIKESNPFLNKIKNE